MPIQWGYAHIALITGTKNNGRGELAQFLRSHVHDTDATGLGIPIFPFQMYWYPGGAANKSTTCVEDGEEWQGHRYVDVYTFSALVLRRNEVGNPPRICYRQRNDSVREHAKNRRGDQLCVMFCVYSCVQRS